MVGDKIHDARDTAYIEGRRLREKKRREHFLLTVCSARAGIGAIFMAPNQSRAEQGHVRTCLRTHLNHTSPLLLLFAVCCCCGQSAECGERRRCIILVDLVDGMRTVPPTQASILILDEINDAGVDNCNITLVDALMRFIYEQRQGIHLIVVLTQNQGVADELCRLNEWQKIAPLDGLTNPTRQQVRGMEATMPSDDEAIPWNPKALEWSLENLTKFIDTRFKGHDFKKAGEDDEKKGIITWLELGMTPTAAE